MNKQEAIRRMKREQFQVPYGPGIFVHAVFMDKAIELISQIDQPQKVAVPKFVAEWIEELKKSRSNLAWVWEVYPNDPKIKNWLESNTEKFMRAWLDGFEIEQEQLYTVEIPNPNADGYSIVLGRKEGKVLIKQDWSTTWEMNCSNQLTEAEIKQDFEWAWQFATPVEVE
ncbi:DUF1642 domain-containing protein [Streptococcus suis]|uniref:DUF1642 domain-containing protein n=1 Tax=Streptococcus suis TaxID=1307 RepID=UPI000CF48BE0|nr:DUF1642 domain-containing protein [Streptococcus suis]